MWREGPNPVAGWLHSRHAVKHSELLGHLRLGKNGCYNNTITSINKLNVPWKVSSSHKIVLLHSRVHQVHTHINMTYLACICTTAAMYCCHFLVFMVYTVSLCTTYHARTNFAMINTIKWLIHTTTCNQRRAVWESTVPSNTVKNGVLLALHTWGTTPSERF